MGTIIEIDKDYVMVKFDDGNIRKYLKENFIYEPKLNKVVKINNYGMLVDIEREQESNHIKNILILILILVIGGILLYLFIRSAINFGNEVMSCIEGCE